MRRQAGTAQVSKCEQRETPHAAPPSRMRCFKKSISFDLNSAVDAAWLNNARRLKPCCFSGRKLTTISRAASNLPRCGCGEFNADGKHSN